MSQLDVSPPKLDVGLKKSSQSRSALILDLFSMPAFKKPLMWLQKEILFYKSLLESSLESMT